MNLIGGICGTSILASYNFLHICMLQGRRGKGSIWVWSAGSGGDLLDSCAADGYASSIYTIAIGAANSDGTAAYYDEMCSGKMATAIIGNQFAGMQTEMDILKVVGIYTVSLLNIFSKFMIESTFTIVSCECMSE